jgi:hypothetical protein
LTVVAKHSAASCAILSTFTPDRMCGLPVKRFLRASARQSE